MKSADFFIVKYIGCPPVVIIGLFLIGRNTLLLMAANSDLNAISALWLQISGQFFYMGFYKGLAFVLAGLAILWLVRRTERI